MLRGMSGQNPSNPVSSAESRSKLGEALATLWRTEGLDDVGVRFGPYVMDELALLAKQVIESALDGETFLERVQEHLDEHAYSTLLRNARRFEALDRTVVVVPHSAHTASKDGRGPRSRSIWRPPPNPPRPPPPPPPLPPLRDARARSLRLFRQSGQRLGSLVNPRSA